jgi:hypothetical protein
MEKQPRPIAEVPFDARPKAKEEVPSYSSSLTPATLLAEDFHKDSMADSIEAMSYGDLRDIGRAMFEIMTRPSYGSPDAPDKISNLIFTWAREHNARRATQEPTDVGISDLFR